MERLTERDWKERFDLKELHPRYKRLAEYEDIELEPSEIASLKEALERSRTECKQLHDDMNESQEEIDRLRSESYEYQRLEQEGLLVKLPRKVGDTVYWISPFKSGINHGKIEFINMNKFGYDLGIMSYSGTLSRRELEKVFLTREEAEQVLMGSDTNEAK